MGEAFAGELLEFLALDRTIGVTLCRCARLLLLTLINVGFELQHREINEDERIADIQLHFFWKFQMDKVGSTMGM